jgi:hypothetical protein
MPAGDIPNPLAVREIWAVGATAGSKGGNVKGTVLHYDGAAWTFQTLPLIDRQFQLLSVVAFSATDVWVAGFEGQMPRPLVLHYDGIAWSKVTTPNPGADAGGSALFAIAGSGPTDLYAVGIQPTGSLVMHFDGATWAVEATPAPEAGTIEALLAVDVQASGEVWGVGFSIGGSLSFDTLSQHRATDGTWTDMTTPSPGDLSFIGSVLSLDEGPIWAAGSFVPTGRNTSKNLLLRCG